MRQSSSCLSPAWIVLLEHIVVHPCFGLKLFNGLGPSAWASLEADSAKQVVLGWAGPHVEAVPVVGSWVLDPCHLGHVSINSLALFEPLGVHLDVAWPGGDLCVLDDDPTIAKD